MSENIKMVHVRATCNQVYANKYLKAGDPFPFAIPANVAASLIKNHYAAIDASYQTRARPRVEQKDLIADEETETTEDTSSAEVVAQAEQADESELEQPEAEAIETATPRRRSSRYKTRDMKAEDK